MSDVVKKRNPDECVLLADTLFALLVKHHQKQSTGGTTELTYHLNPSGVVDKVHVEDSLAVSVDAGREIAKTQIDSRRKHGRQGHIRLSVVYGDDGTPADVVLKELSIIS